MDWQVILVTLIYAFIILNAALVAVAFLVYFERKVAAHMQARQGPNRAGPIGLLQSFADLLKGLKKEYIIPRDSDRWVFHIAPIVSTFAAVSALAFLPLGPASDQPGGLNIFGVPVNLFIANVGVGVLAILALSSLSVYGLIMAAWGSNSKYPLLGGLRSSAMIISYEITLGISLIGVFLLSSSLNLQTIALAQHPTLHPAGTPGIPFILLQPIAFLTFFVSAIAEAKRIPFDFAETESELVAGYHTEYSGVRFLIFQLAEYVSMIIMSALVVICFLGGWVSPFAAWFDNTDIPFLSGLLGSGIHWFFIKLGLLIFAYYWIRWTLPRFRYDQLMGLCWKVLLPVILANIMLVGVLRLLFFPPGTPLTEYNPLYWWLLAGVQVLLAIPLLIGFSRVAGLSWFGRAERPVLVDRQLILVRNVQGGRGTIEGEAKTVTSET
jgi:NADH-quinone oxidoreductase subunit H